MATTTSRRARPRAVTERGERRREALLDSATALLEQEGFAAVSHRAVAARAGLPLAATTYYFASLEELVEQAVRRWGERHQAHARAVVAALPQVPPRRPMPTAELAALLVDLVIGAAGEHDHASLLTFYERYVQAGRHRWLRPLVRGWNAELRELVAEALRRAGRAGRHADPDLARLLVAAVDGLFIGLLVEGDERAPALVRANLARLLSDLLEGRGR